MLADSAPTWPNPQAGEKLQWTIASRMFEIAGDSWNIDSSFQAQSSSNARDVACMNDNDMLVDSEQDMPEAYLEGSKRYYGEWLGAQFAYP